MLSELEPEELVVGPARAAEALYEQFGALIDADYLSGKTTLRDALCDRLGMSQLEAEDMCDSMEQAGLLRFIDTPEGAGWNIHPDPDSAVPVNVM
jgi:hypothetical protein